MKRIHILIFIAPALLGICQSTHAQQDSLYNEIARMDSVLFAAYNTRDLEKLKSIFSADLEFYHDLTGFTDYAYNIDAFQTNFSKPLKMRRALVRSSLEVYPIKDYGAIEIGTHEFYAAENGKPEQLVSTPKFIHIWRKKDGVWQVTRIVSYSHDTSDPAQRLNRLMDGLFIDHKIMAGLAISRAGQPVYSKYTGWSRMTNERQYPANDQTTYRIGSISKMFTTVLVLQMVEEGQLSLDQTLSRFYPRIPNAQKITIEDLLRHRSGLGDIKSIPNFDNWVREAKTKQQILEAIGERPISFAPGSRYEYNNSGFILLSYILENISGQSFADLLKERITEKIGLKNTYYAETRGTRANESYSYRYDAGWKPVAETDFSIPTGSGGIVASPADLCTFISALFSGSLLTPEQFRLMQSMEGDHGMGMFEFTFGSQHAYGHNGNMDGYYSYLLYFPTSSIALAYTANGQSEPLDDVIKKIVETMFSK